MSRLGCNCGNARFGQSTDQYGNVLDYSGYYDTASATAENIWNDVESAGVWLGNEVKYLWNNNPIDDAVHAAEQAGGTGGNINNPTPIDTALGVTPIARGIDAIASIGIFPLLIGGIVLFAILDRK